MLKQFETILLSRIITFKYTLPAVTVCRNGHWMRGKRPGVARSLEQRLADESPVETDVMKPVNIGFPRLRTSRSEELKERLNHLRAQRKNPDLEKKARDNSISINLNDVKIESQKSAGQYHIKTIADHYGIFKDLFGLAYFVPRIPLEINYRTDDGIHKVYNGNIIKPRNAIKEPDVNFDSKTKFLLKDNENSFWTIIMTTPDGHFSGKNKEYVHWFIGNIPENNVNKGENIVSYLQPFPPRGIGYQRYIFILYRHNKKLNYDSFKLTEMNNIDKRTFSTYEFYKKYQDDITPAGLSFFQSDWDSSLTEFYHKVVGIKEPIVEYDFPKPYISDDKWFPLRQPFNLYLDKHRDQKKINKEYLEKKLSKTHPFDGSEPELRFPNAHPVRDVPSWLRTEIQKDRLKMGRINDV